MVIHGQIRQTFWFVRKGCTTSTTTFYTARYYTTHKPSATSYRTCTVSGIQPTGIPHLGNYLGAIRTWVHLQNMLIQPQDLVSTSTTPNVLYMIADQHALTVPGSPTKSTAQRLQSNVYDLACTLIACGIDPAKSVLFRQSRVPQHTELAWMLMCRTPVGWVARMHQWRTKLQMMSTKPHGTDTDMHDVADTNLNVGLLTYPVLQSADILLYKATHVPVGEDQTQHLNLTAELARTMNKTTGRRLFPVPNAILSSSAGKRVMSLRVPTSKMSKSDPSDMSRIQLDDSADTILSKVRKATSDSIQGVTYDPENRPGVTNLVRIVMSLEMTMQTDVGDSMSAVSRFQTAIGTWDGIALTDESALAQRVHERFGGMSNSQFKAHVADVINAAIDPIRSELVRLRQDKASVGKLLEGGEEHARAIAEQTMQEIRSTVGMA